jgi:hypothetical protein
VGRCWFFENSRDKLDRLLLNADSCIVEMDLFASSIDDIDANEARLFDKISLSRMKETSFCSGFMDSTSPFNPYSFEISISGSTPVFSACFIRC